MQPDTDWDIGTLRRSMRLLGAHSTQALHVQSTARALRLVRDMLQRRNIPTELFQLPGLMPLIVAGRGPVLLNTYLDDSSPQSVNHRGDPPEISNDGASGPGVTRKAGLLAVLGAFLCSPTLPEQATLVIEADRHVGSAAMEAWLRATPASFSAGLYEVADLPVAAPALYAAATGVVVLEIIVQQAHAGVEQFYGGVLPDVGHQLIEAVSALKSRDAEVLVPSFYDNVAAPDMIGMAALNNVASRVGAWITRNAGATDTRLNASHLTLGISCAPALLIRELEMTSAAPYLPSRARATIEVRIMPGQDVHALIGSIRAFITERVPEATVEPLLLRNAAHGWSGSMPDLGATILPISPGDSPAGLMESTGISTLGFSTVSRDPAVQEESIPFSSIIAGSSLVTSLVSHVAGTHPAPTR